MADEQEEEDNSLGAGKYPCMPSLVALQQMRNRLALAHLGRKLMNWTALATGRELRRLAEELNMSYGHFYDNLAEAYISLARCRYYVPYLNTLVTEHTDQKAQIRIENTIRSVAGVKTIIFNTIELKMYPSYTFLGIGQGGEAVAEAKAIWINLLKQMIQILQLRDSFLAVDVAHRNARKQKKMLTLNIMPKLIATIEYILTELEMRIKTLSNAPPCENIQICSSCFKGSETEQTQISYLTKFMCKDCTQLSRWFSNNKEHGYDSLLSVENDLFNYVDEHKNELKGLMQLFETQLKSLGRNSGVLDKRSNKQNKSLQALIKQVIKVESIETEPVKSDTVDDCYFKNEDSLEMLSKEVITEICRPIHVDRERLRSCRPVYPVNVIAGQCATNNQKFINLRCPNTTADISLSCSMVSEKLEAVTEPSCKICEYKTPASNSTTEIVIKESKKIIVIDDKTPPCAKPLVVSSKENVITGTARTVDSCSSPVEERKTKKSTTRARSRGSKPFDEKIAKLLKIIKIMNPDGTVSKEKRITKIVEHRKGSMNTHVSCRCYPTSAGEKNKDADKKDKEKDNIVNCNDKDSCTGFNRKPDDDEGTARCTVQLMKEVMKLIGMNREKKDCMKPYCVEPVSVNVECIEQMSQSACKKSDSVKVDCIEQMSQLACEKPDNVNIDYIEHMSQSACEKPDSVKVDYIEQMSQPACKKPDSVKVDCIEQMSQSACGKPDSVNEDFIEQMSQSVCGKPDSVNVDFVEQMSQSACKKADSVKVDCIEQMSQSVCGKPDSVNEDFIEQMSQSVCGKPYSVNVDFVEQMSQSACKKPDSVKVDCIEQMSQSACEKPDRVNVDCIKQMSQSAYEKPDSEISKNIKPKFVNSVSMKPECMNPDCVKLVCVKPECDHSNCEKPICMNSDCVIPNSVEPDKVKSGSIKLDSIKPDSEKSHSLRSNSVKDKASNEGDMSRYKKQGYCYCIPDSRDAESTKVDKMAKKDDKFETLMNEVIILIGMARDKTERVKLKYVKSDSVKPDNMKQNFVESQSEKPLSIKSGLPDGEDINKMTGHCYSNLDENKKEQDVKLCNIKGTSGDGDEKIENDERATKNIENDKKNKNFETLLLEVKNLIGMVQDDQECVKLECVKPECVKLDSVKPLKVKSDTEEPTCVKSDSVKPDCVKPICVKPDFVNSDCEKPVCVKSDPVIPDCVKPVYQVKSNPVKPKCVKPEYLPLKGICVKPDCIRPDSENTKCVKSEQFDDEIKGKRYCYCKNKMEKEIAGISFVQSEKPCSCKNEEQDDMKPEAGETAGKSPEQVDKFNFSTVLKEIKKLLGMDHDKADCGKQNCLKQECLKPELCECNDNEDDKRIENCTLDCVATTNVCGENVRLINFFETANLKDLKDNACACNLTKTKLKKVKSISCTVKPAIVQSNCQLCNKKLSLMSFTAEIVTDTNKKDSVKPPMCGDTVLITDGTASKEKQLKTRDSKESRSKDYFKNCTATACCRNVDRKKCHQPDSEVCCENKELAHCICHGYENDEKEKKFKEWKKKKFESNKKSKHCPCGDKKKPETETIDILEVDSVRCITTGDSVLSYKQKLCKDCNRKQTANNVISLPYTCEKMISSQKMSFACNPIKIENCDGCTNVDSFIMKVISNKMPEEGKESSCLKPEDTLPLAKQSKSLKKTMDSEITSAALTCTCLYQKLTDDITAELTKLVYKKLLKECIASVKMYDRMTRSCASNYSMNCNNSCITIEDFSLDLKSKSAKKARSMLLTQCGLEDPSENDSNKCYVAHQQNSGSVIKSGNNNCYIMTQSRNRNLDQCFCKSPRKNSENMPQQLSFIIKSNCFNTFSKTDLNDSKVDIYELRGLLRGRKLQRKEKEEFVSLQKAKYSCEQNFNDESFQKLTNYDRKCSEVNQKCSFAFTNGSAKGNFAPLTQTFSGIHAKKSDSICKNCLVELSGISLSDSMKESSMKCRMCQMKADKIRQSVKDEIINKIAETAASAAGFEVHIIKATGSKFDKNNACTSKTLSFEKYITNDSSSFLVTDHRRN